MGADHILVPSQGMAYQYHIVAVRIERATSLIGNRKGAKLCAAGEAQRLVLAENDGGVMLDCAARVHGYPGLERLRLAHRIDSLASGHRIGRSVAATLSTLSLIALHVRFPFSPRRCPCTLGATISHKTAHSN